MPRKVVALRMGITGGKRRRPGDIFEIPDDKPLGRWMAPAEDIAPPPPPPVDPQTLSELGRAQHPGEPPSGTI